MKGNFHVQFLGEGVAATSPPYPTPGWATTQVYPARITLQGPKAAAGSRQPSSHGTAPTPKFHVVTPNESFSCGEHAKTRLLYKFSTNYQDVHRCPGIWLEFA